MQNNRNMKKKNKGLSLGSAVLIIAAVLGSFADELDGDTFFPVVIFVAVIAMVIGVLSFVRKARKKAAVSQPLHSHDRLHPSETVRCESGMEHWKNQLDGFLATGIIDRNEYRVLWERYMRELKGR